MTNNLQCVIDWLEAGCDPKAAAEELRAIAALAQPACTHDETERLGAIWTHCTQCGKKWADDEQPAIKETT